MSGCALFLSCGDVARQYAPAGALLRMHGKLAGWLVRRLHQALRST